MDFQKSATRKRLNAITFAVAAAIGTLLIISGGISVSSKAQRAKIEQQGAENDLRTRDLNHIVETIPRCIANCIFPQILDSGCTHTDYGCVCANLRSLDNPKPPVKQDPYILEVDSSVAWEDDAYVLLEDVNQPVDTRFKDCYDGCTYQEQLGSGSSILNLCAAFQVSVEFPEVMVPMIKRTFDANGAVASGSHGASLPPSLPTQFSASIHPIQSIAPTGDTSRPSSSVQSHDPPVGTSSGKTPSKSSDNNGGGGSSGGLSSDAKIGIGIAIPLIVIIALGIGAFFFLRHRRRRQELIRGAAANTNTNEGGISELMGKTELPKPGQVQYYNAEGRLPVEAGGVPINELDHNAFGQMPQGTSPFELHGQTVSAPMHASTPTPRDNSASPASGAAAVPPGTSTPSSFPPPWANVGSQNILISGEAASSAQPPPQEPQPPPQIQPPEQPQPPPQQTPTPGTAPLATTQDAELAFLEQEMDQVRQRKERLRNLQELEAKEEELQKRINEKKAASAAGATPGGSGVS